MKTTIESWCARLQPPRRAPSRLRMAAALAAILAACVAHGQEISRAETLLFLSDHLERLSPPKALHYRFVHREQHGQSFRDTVTVRVAARQRDGSAAVSAQFLHGVHAHPLPPVDGARGNPALLGFLERDIAEMQRLTGGASSYFRKRIRLALAQDARLAQVAVAYRGRAFQATEIAIQPYLNDPMREKMPKFAAKRYVFVLCDAVPGAVYQIRSTVPAGADGMGGEEPGAAWIEETMRFDGIAG